MFGGFIGQTVSDIVGGVKDVLKNPIADMALSYFGGPILGSFINSNLGLGLSGALSSAIGAGAIGGGISALEGGNPISGALMSGGLQYGASQLGSMMGFGAGVTDATSGGVAIDGGPYGKDQDLLSRLFGSPNSATTDYAMSDAGGAAGGRMYVDPSMIRGSGGGGLGGLLGGLSNRDLLMGGGMLYENMQANNQAKRLMAASDPFSQYRPGAASQLNSLMSNPSSLTSTPGYQAGMDAVQRSMAAQGYNGSGNMMAALQQYGGNAYNQQVQTLAGLSGASSSPVATAQVGAQGLGNQSANSLLLLSLLLGRG